jgi:microsomal dipeptidase-like Zn-dependent dipeptidase
VIADLHAHYAMHVVPEARGNLWQLLTTPLGQARLRDRIRALGVGLASRAGNHRSFTSGPRVTVPSMREGEVRVALSVLYSFWDELELGEPYPAPPKAEYLDTLRRQLQLVESDVTARHGEAAMVARDPSALEAALSTDSGRVVLVHCIEGGFHLGDTPEAVDRAVRELAARGVAYITLAHLVWRHVATDAPAIPFLPDWLYKRLFSQPEAGLSELGRAAIRAMVRERVIVDLSHMSARALDETFALLDELDPGGRVPCHRVTRLLPVRHPGVRPLRSDREGGSPSATG